MRTYAQCMTRENPELEPGEVVGIFYLHAESPQDIQNLKNDYPHDFVARLYDSPEYESLSVGDRIPFSGQTELVRIR